MTLSSPRMDCSVLSHIAWQRLQTADVPLLLGSRPRRLATISHQLHTLTAGLSRVRPSGAYLPGCTDFQLPTSNFSCQFSTDFRDELTHNAQSASYVALPRAASSSSFVIVCVRCLAMARLLLRLYTAVGKNGCFLVPYSSCEAPCRNMILYQEKSC
jgi:hypothetical protein